VPARIDLFRVPTRISFGRGVALTVADPLGQVGATKVLLVTDPGVRKVGLTGPIEQVWGRFSRSDVVVGERHGPCRPLARLSGNRVHG